MSRYGASQMGALVEYSFAGARGPRAYLRANRALVARGEAEIAAGLRYDFQFVPVAIHVERRVAANAAGRNAFALFASGGFSTGELSRVAFEGYGQAGVVGLTRRTPFADASLVARRRVLGSDSAGVSIGLGSWAGSQPHATRIDIGPRIEADLARGAGRVRVSLDWRERVAGTAAPDSGPALSVSAAF